MTPHNNRRALQTDVLILNYFFLFMSTHSYFFALMSTHSHFFALMSAKKWLCVLRFMSSWVWVHIAVFLHSWVHITGKLMSTHSFPHVLSLQWSVNNWQKWKEVQAHVHNSISCLCICRNTLWRTTTNKIKLNKIKQNKTE